MSTYTQILYQIVFSTKEREQTLLESSREKLFRYVWGVLKERDSVLYQVNGMEDHIHIVTHIHPTIALADLIKDIKVGSSLWIKENNIFPEFTAWQAGYGAFTYTIKEKEALIRYVKNQKEHHLGKTFRDEYIDLLHEHGIEFEEKFLF